jgi:outer membrane protein TolC
MRLQIKPGRIAFVILLLGLAAGAFPQALTLSTLDEIAATGREMSIDYARAKLSAEKAASEVPDLLKIKSTSLSGTYSYTGAKTGLPGPSANPTSELSASLDVPLIDQVSLSASIKDDGSGRVNAAVKPLYHADTRTQKMIAYEKAVAAMEDAAKNAANSAVKAALKWMASERLLATKERAAVYAEDVYKAAKAARDIDQSVVSLDEVSKALSSWSKARSDLITQQTSTRNAKAEFIKLLGTSEDDIEIKMLGTEELEQALTALKSSLAGAESSGPAASYSVRSAELDLQSKSSTAKSIWVFEPDLSLSAGFSFSRESDPVASISATLKLSLDNLKTGDKAQAEAQLKLAAKTLAQTKIAQESEYAQALARVKTAAISTENQRLSRDQAAEIRDEAAFLFAHGSYSELENESAALSLAQAEDALYQALVDEYSAWLDLAALSGK